MEKTFADRKKEKQQNRFVGRTDFIESFTNNLDSSDYFTFLNIYGQGGVGKSYLSKKFISIANEKNCLTIYTDGSIKSLLEWMENVSSQFKDKDAELTEFDKRYKTYLQETKKLETDPEKPKGILGSVTKTLMKGAIKEVKRLPGAGLVGGFFDEEIITSTISEWVEFARKKIGNKDEVELVLEPVKVLTPLFWKGIHKSAENKKVICFFIDTYEETGKFLEKWLLSVLHEVYGDIVPYNVRFVIVGRDELAPNEWNEFAELTLEIPLESFTEPEANYYLTSHKIDDINVRRDILHLSGRLPVMMSWLVDAAKNKIINEDDFCEDAVERFLKWVDEPDKRKIALVCALPRFISQDVVRVISEDKNKASFLFSWLLTQPFVQKKGDYWVYHTVVRNQLLRFARTHSNKEWREYHGQLGNYYSLCQINLEIDSNEFLNHKEWLHYEQERLYHSLCYKPDKTLPLLIADVIAVWYDKGLTFSVRWAETLLQAGVESNHGVCEDWALRIKRSINEYEFEGKTDALQKLALDIISKNYVENGLTEAFLFMIIGNDYYYKDDKDKAIEYYQKAIDVKPDYADAFFNMGNIYSDNGDNAKGIEYYQKAIDIKPDNAGAFNNMGNVYINKGDNDKATEYYQKAIDIKPDNADAFYNMGLAYFHQGDNDKATEYYQKSIDIKPDNPNAFYNMGLAYFRQGNNDKAIECYQKAIDIKPDYADAFLKMGAAYFDKGDKYEAIECYQEAIDIKPDNADAFFNMGLAYFHQGDNDKAVEYYQKGIDIKPDNPDACNNMGLAYFHQGDNDKAIEYYQKAIDIKPDNADAFNNMGNVYINKGDNDKATEYYQKAIGIKADNADAFFNMGLAYFHQGDNDKAIEFYQKAIGIKPDNAGAFYNMGLAYFHRGDNNKAIECYQKAIDIKPDYVNAFYNIGLAYFHQGDNDKAIECYQKVIYIKSDHAAAFMSIGFIYLKLGNLEKAEKRLQQSIVLASNGFAYMNLGHVFLAKKNEAAAIDCYKNSLSVFTNKEKFWKDMKDDFQYLEQYGITIDYYNNLLEKIANLTS